MSIAKKRAVFLVGALVLVLAGCGGGGGGGGSGVGSSAGASGFSSLGGVAAVGSPIVNADARVICASGPSLAPVKTDASGNWQVALSGQSLPCAVEVSGGTINGSGNTTIYHSVAVNAARVNVTPLTDLLVANMVGNASPTAWFTALNANAATLGTLTQAQADTALSNLSAALPALPLFGTGNNPITSVFTPTAGNSHDDMLSALQTAMTNAGVSYTSLLASVSSSPTSAAAALGSALSTAYHGTSSGSTAVYFPVESVLTMLDTSALTISSSGTYQGNSLSVTQTSTPRGPQSFAGLSAMATSLGGSLSYQGSTAALSATTTYYSVAPYKRLGEVGSNYFTAYANQIPLPNTATTGSSGNFATGTDYADSSRRTVLDTFVQTWSLTVGATANTANLCITTTGQVPSSTAAPSSVSTCLKIDTNGNILQWRSLGYINGTPVTLTSTSITTPPPVVVASVPAWGSSGVSVVTPITLLLSNPIDPATVNNASFSLSVGYVPVAGTVSVAGATLSFTPGAPLRPNTSYTATVSGTVSDASGNALGSSYSWNFQTRSAVSVATVSPTPYSYASGLGGTVSASFSSAVNASTVTASNFSVSGPSGAVAGTVTYAGTTATFTPSVPLVVNAIYRASISSGIKDLGGDPVVSRTWTFQTFAPGTSSTPQPFTPIPTGLWQPAAGATPSSGNYVYLESDLGDYVGQGRTYTFTPYNAQLSLVTNTSGVLLNISGNSFWSGNFVGPTAMGPLQVGYYSGLIRWPFHNPVLGGLDWSGDGRGCNSLLGWFSVDSVTYVSGSVTALDLRFEQQCEGGQTALHGVVHWGP